MRTYGKMLMVVLCAAGWVTAVTAAPPRQYMPAGYSNLYGQRVWHGDGCDCDSWCDPCWDPCRPHCGLGIVPAVIRGVDRILYSVFAGFRCCDPCGPGCGGVGCAAPACTDCHNGLEMVPSTPVPAPEEMSRYRTYAPPMARSGSRPMRQPTYYPSAHIRSRPTPRPQTLGAEPDVRSTSAESSEPLRRTNEPVQLVPVENSLRPVSHEAEPAKTTRSVPYNPLRD